MSTNNGTTVAETVQTVQPVQPPEKFRSIKDVTKKEMSITYTNEEDKEMYVRFTKVVCDWTKFTSMKCEKSARGIMFDLYATMRFMTENDQMWVAEPIEMDQIIKATDIIRAELDGENCPW